MRAARNGLFAAGPFLVAGTPSPCQLPVKITFTEIKDHPPSQARVNITESGVHYYPQQQATS